MREATTMATARLQSSKPVLVVIIAMIVVVVTICNLQVVKFDGINARDEVVPTARGLYSSFGNGQVCPHVVDLYSSNETALELLHKTLQDGDRYHRLGGSLKSVQKYLDGQIGDTINRLGLGYEPTTTTQEKESTSGKSEHQGAVDYLAEYYRTHSIPRGGYGQPLPIRWKSENGGKKDTVKHVLYEDRWMDALESWSPDRFRASVGPVLEPTCPHFVEFAKGTYEEKVFCVLENDVHSNDDDENKTQPTKTASIDNDEGNNDECHVFSIGSNDQWGFEIDVRRLLPHCHTHTFDCTLNGNTPKRKPKDDMVKFYPYCIGTPTSTDTGTNNNATQQYLSYADLHKVTKISATSPPKLFKMDIEGFEFDVVLAMLTEESSADPSLWPEQIMMEVLFATRMVGVEWMVRTRQTAEMALFFDMLFNVGGYMPMKIKYFRGCPTCMEILLIRVQC